MAKTDAWTLAWAQGPGRQSGAWALSAAAVALIPFLDGIRPPCNTTNCAQVWERVFFVPDLLFMPAVLAAAVLAGSWLAQRRHAKFDKRFYDELDPNQVPETPPGHLRPKVLEDDLTRRTLQMTSLAGLVVAGVYVFLTTTPIGRRACDPVKFSQPTGLERCSGPAQWSDAIIAYEVWLFIAIAVIGAVVLWFKSRRFVERKERRLFSLRRASQTP